jgi:hypothetical protein
MRCASSVGYGDSWRDSTDWPPAGYGIGINAAAGQTVPRLHTHLPLPYESNCDDPRGDPQPPVTFRAVNSVMTGVSCRLAAKDAAVSFGG